MERCGQPGRSQSPPCQGLQLSPCALLLHRDPATLAQSVHVPSCFLSLDCHVLSSLLGMLLFSPPVFLSQPTCPHSHFTSNVISWRGPL